LFVALDSETGDDLVYQLTEEFSDKEALQEVLEADANTVSVPSDHKEVYCAIGACPGRKEAEGGGSEPRE